MDNFALLRWCAQNKQLVHHAITITARPVNLDSKARRNPGVEQIICINCNFQIVCVATPSRNLYVVYAQAQDDNVWTVGAQGRIRGMSVTCWPFRIQVSVDI